MALDELTKENPFFRVSLTKVPLNFDKNIFLVRAFEEDLKEKKKYMRSALILVGNEIITSRFSDTIHFIEELNLYDFGNDQNQYLDITEFKNTKNLRLKLTDKIIYLSKSECKTMSKLFNFSLSGYTMSRVLEFEYTFTPETLTRALNDFGYLEIER